MEDLMKAFILKIDVRLEAHSSAIKELGTGFRNLERQVGQLAIILSERISDPTPVQKDRELEKGSREQLKIEVDKKKKGKKGDEKKKKEENSRKEEHEESKHISALTNAAYAKFLKEIVTKKRKIEETSVVKLTEHGSAILQNILPQKKLENEVGGIRSAPITLQLADQTTLMPEGIVEVVLVWVDKFVFPVDFIVVKMEENKEVPDKWEF
ncbi:uncharacterized protein [Nicotiana sylvestris]|uniref:uncharacterized protein n=1 Tax=Nicotiana sylvestris TaxID=4096 RepID=UPI00388C50A6